MNQIGTAYSFKDITLANSNDAIGKTLNDLQKYRVVIRSFLWENQPYSNQIYLIRSKNYYELYNGIDKLKQDTYWNPRAKFIIIINNMIGFMNETSRLLVLNNIFNVIVVTKTKEVNNFSLYGFLPVKDNCNRPKVRTLQLVSNCTKLGEINNFLFRISVFPSDCKVKLFTREYEPFNYAPGKGISGIDEYILKLWEQRHNMTIELRNTGRSSRIENFIKNFSDANAFLSENHNHAVGMFGGFSYNMERRAVLDFSYPYMVDHDIIIIARTPDLGKWEAIIHRFSSIIGVLLICLFVIFCIMSSLLLVFVKKGKDIVRDVLIVYGYFLTNISVKKLNTRFVARIVILSLLLFVFLMVNIIQAFLLSASTRPIRRQQVNDIEQVYKTFKPIILKSWKWKFEDQTNDMDFCDVVSECMEKLINSNKLMFTSISDTYYNLISWEMIDNFGRFHLYRVREPARYVYRVMYFTRGSTVLSSLNRHIHKMTDNGLISHHIQTMEFQARLKSKIKYYDGYDSTDMSEIKEPFIVLLLGYFISILVFVYECFSKKVSPQQ
ncbi:uncharacterized protein LOC128201798 [Galleria mellonella]|uniref:Uncharacterized protein LOC128201798 n=1 Tax=Galleria mellonella TaxID=7137 RepID=A0ABM3MWM7_GALME|nr:uncharacterized protein LOC128201798 [Galleria mellonella]